MNYLEMKMNTKNCRTEFSISLGTGAFIVKIVEREYQIAITAKYNL